MVLLFFILGIYAATQRELAANAAERRRLLQQGSDSNVPQIQQSNSNEATIQTLYDDRANRRSEIQRFILSPEHARISSPTIHRNADSSAPISHISQPDLTVTDSIVTFPEVPYQPYDIISYGNYIPDETVAISSSSSSGAIIGEHEHSNRSENRNTWNP